MKKFLGVLCCFFILAISSRAAGGNGDKFSFTKSESSLEKSRKVVGVTITVTNNTAHTLTFSYNGVTSGSFTVNAHSSFNGKISAQPGSVYTITVSESSLFYYLDNAGNNGGPVTSSPPLSVTLNNGYSMTAN